MDPITVVGQFILGQSLPGLIDLINRKVTSSRVRFWIAFVICLMMGVLASVNDVNMVVANPSIPGVLKIFQAGVLIFTSSQIAYKQWYDQSVIQAKIKNPLP